MNSRRLAALERRFAADASPSCKCLLAYRSGEPEPPLTGTCPVCGLMRTGDNTLIKEVIIETREEAEAFFRQQEKEL
jgi:hypothetical protein